MNKSKKIAIGLLSTFGVSLLVSTPLIILSSTQKQIKQPQNNVDHKSRYRLNNWITNKNKDVELFSYFFAAQDMLKNTLEFDETNFNKWKIKTFFKNILFEIFKYSQDDTDINLKIDYKINEFKDKCTLNLNWYFIHKKHNIILKNTKYYDILMLYF